jgi:hypothetical protein
VKREEREREIKTKRKIMEAHRSSNNDNTGTVGKF